MVSQHPVIPSTSPLYPTQNKTFTIKPSDILKSGENDRIHVQLNEGYISAAGHTQVEIQNNQGGVQINDWGRVNIKNNHAGVVARNSAKIAISNVGGGSEVTLRERASGYIEQYHTDSTIRVKGKDAILVCEAATEVFDRHISLASKKNTSIPDEEKPNLYNIAESLVTRTTLQNESETNTQQITPSTFQGKKQTEVSKEDFSNITHVWIEVGGKKFVVGATKNHESIDPLVVTLFGVNDSGVVSFIDARHSYLGEPENPESEKAKLRLKSYLPDRDPTELDKAIAILQISHLYRNINHFENLLAENKGTSRAEVARSRLTPIITQRTSKINELQQQILEIQPPAVVPVLRREPEQVPALTPPSEAQVTPVPAVSTAVSELPERQVRAPEKPLDSFLNSMPVPTQRNLETPEGAGTEIINGQEYKVIGPIGKGKFGFGYFATDAQQNPVAIKKTSASLTQDSEIAIKEISTLKKVNAAEEAAGRHYSVRLRGAESDQNYHTIVMELATGVNIANLIYNHDYKKNGPVQLREYASLATEFAQALTLAHQAGVTYDDMKLDNLFWDPNRKDPLRIIDWNVTGDVSQKGTSNDWAKFAARLYELSTGKYAEIDRDGNLQTNLQSNPQWENLSFGLKAFILKATSSNRVERFTDGNQVIEFIKQEISASSLSESELLAQANRCYSNNDTTGVQLYLWHLTNMYPDNGEGKILSSKIQTGELENEANLFTKLDKDLRGISIEGGIHSPLTMINQIQMDLNGSANPILRKYYVVALTLNQLDSSIYKGVSVDFANFLNKKNLSIEEIEKFFEEITPKITETLPEWGTIGYTESQTKQENAIKLLDLLKLDLLADKYYQIYEQNNDLNYLAAAYQANTDVLHSISYPLRGLVNENEFPYLNKRKTQYSAEIYKKLGLVNYDRTSTNHQQISQKAVNTNEAVKKGDPLTDLDVFKKLDNFIPDGYIKDLQSIGRDLLGGLNSQYVKSFINMHLSNFFDPSRLEIGLRQVASNLQESSPTKLLHNFMTREALPKELRIEVVNAINRSNRADLKTPEETPESYLVLLDAYIADNPSDTNTINLRDAIYNSLEERFRNPLKDCQIP